MAVITILMIDIGYKNNVSANTVGSDTRHQIVVG